MLYLAAADFKCQCPASHQQTASITRSLESSIVFSYVTAAQLDNVESRQVEAPPAADVSNQDDAAVLEEEIHELQHVVRCPP